MKTRLIIFAFIAGSLLWTSCSKDIEAPSLPTPESVTIAEGVTLDANQLFGVWEGASQVGETSVSHFAQSYKMEFQSVDDETAVFSHWYIDAITYKRDSVYNQEYTYKFDGKTIELTPTNAAKSQGAVAIKAVHVGNNVMELYTVNESVTTKMCTLSRTGDPEPAITGVDRTLPQVGEKVTITGRNLQFVDHLYLPTATGELEVTDFEQTSKQIQFIVPEGTYQAGSIRCQATGAHLSTYSPAYMFCYDAVYMHNFYEQGTKAPYKGTEFEYSIKVGNTTPRNTVSYLKSADLPAGHSLLSADATVLHPDSLLSFFGDEPVAWQVDGTTDPSKGYLRFSTGDRFQYVLDNCGGILTAETPCADAAIQMDIYVYSDGNPEWSTGYFSYRMDKDYSAINNEWAGNVAPWTQESPLSFADGWLTFTIPLSQFRVTHNDGYDTLGGLISWLKKGNKQTIIKLVNYQLDDSHPAHALTSFQFNLANIRLVPYKTPANQRE